MKTLVRWTAALAVVAGVSCNGAVTTKAATNRPVVINSSLMKKMEDDRRAAAEAREKDPAWRPATMELASIQIGDRLRPGALKNFCLNAQGNILACYVPNTTAASSSSGNSPGLRVYSPKGQLLQTLPLEIKPTAVSVAKDGSIFVAGEGRLLKMDAAGKVLASGTSPTATEEVVITKEIEEMIKQTVTRTKRSVADELKNMKTSLERRRTDVTGLAVTDHDVFMAIGSPSDFTYRVYRFDHALQNPKLVVEKLRGCCSQMDIQAQDGKLWIPHNARHAIESRDRDGKELSKFGKAGKVKASDFGGCCEPKNMRVLANGEILAAESGPPTCIKRFSADGKFLGVVALLNEKSECVRVTVDTSPDGSHFYMLDTRHDAIRVFGPRADVR